MLRGRCKHARAACGKRRKMLRAREAAWKDCGDKCSLEEKRWKAVAANVPLEEEEEEEEKEEEE